MKPALSGALALVLAAAAPAVAAPTAEAILAANHAAVGNMPATGNARINYSFSAYGLEGSRTDNIDLQTGAYVEATQADIVGEATGFDGSVPWMRDTSGANTAQQGGDRIAVAVSEAYRLANLWWRPGHAGATVEYVGRQIVAARTLDQLRITPRGGKPFGAWFDSNTHLLALITEDRQFFHTRTEFDEYRTEHGVQVPHRVTLDGGAGKENVEHLQLTAFSFEAAHPLTFYSRPAQPPAGGTISGGASSVTLPFRLLNNHIYTNATVNGKGPYTFIVDTGGHNLLSPRLIKELGLKTIGAQAMSGAGEKTAESGFVHVDEIALGAVQLHNQLGFAAQIYDPSIEGIRVDGMVGFELFRRFAVRIDYGHGTLTFIDPARFNPADAGTAIPFVFYDHLPMVEGLVGDLPARFDIDTGSRSEVDLTGPFVSAHDLRKKFSKGISTVTGWGVGGPARSYVVRLPSLTLGSVAVSSPVAGLSEAKGGSLSDPSYDGNIGSGFLKRFAVTFDYAHQTMYLKPAEPQPVDAGRFDRSGMWINSGPDGYVVTEVAAGGPAANAGIQAGDVITRVDAVAARFDGLADTRALLRSRPPGTKVVMDLKRAGKTTQVALVLADLI